MARRARRHGELKCRAWLQWLRGADPGCQHLYARLKAPEPWRSVSCRVRLAGHGWRVSGRWFPGRSAGGGGGERTPAPGLDRVDAAAAAGDRCILPPQGDSTAVSQRASKASAGLPAGRSPNAHMGQHGPAATDGLEGLPVSPESGATSLPACPLSWPLGGPLGWLCWAGAGSCHGRLACAGRAKRSLAQAGKGRPRPIPQRGWPSNKRRFDPPPSGRQTTPLAHKVASKGMVA